MTVPSDRPYEFHAFDVSYFSAKVRPALRYKRVWYDEIRADARYIKQRTGLAFIPMLITPEDEAWQDSTDIYDRLEARHPEPPLFPATPLQRIAAHLVELYTDEFAAPAVMHGRDQCELVGVELDQVGSDALQGCGGEEGRLGITGFESIIDVG